MCEIKYGVLQGTALGPILFILYIIEICDVKIKGSIVTCADDTCLLFSHNTWEGVYEKSITGFRKVLQILKERNLSLNIEKTVLIPFSNNNSVSTVISMSIHACSNNKDCNSINCKKLIKF